MPHSEFKPMGKPFSSKSAIRPRPIGSDSTQGRSVSSR